MSETQQLKQKTLIEKLVEVTILTAVSMLVVGFFTIIYKGVTGHAEKISQLTGEMEQIKTVLSDNFAQQKVSHELLITEIEELKKVKFNVSANTSTNKISMSDIPPNFFASKQSPFPVQQVPPNVIQKLDWHKKDIIERIEKK